MEKWKKHYNAGIFLISFGIIAALIIIINTILNVTEYLFDFVSRALLMSTPLVISGILNVRYALKHKEDTHFFPDATMYIDRKEIDDLVNESLISGLGLEHEPYRLNINNEEGISRVVMTKIDFYFQIENVNLNFLKIVFCENINIINNNITKLHIRSSSNISIANNRFKLFGYDKRCNNIFTDNNEIIQ